MRSAPYSGKRLAKPEKRHPERHHEHHHHLGGNPVIQMIYFPVLFLYLELVFHLFMHTALRYFPIAALFGLSAGFVLTALTISFPRRVNSVLSKLLTFDFKKAKNRVLLSNSTLFRYKE